MEHEDGHAMSAGILRTVRRAGCGAVILLALQLFVSASALAGEDRRPPPPHGGPPGGGPPPHRGDPPPLEHILERNAERLGLDPAVEAEISATSSASRAEGDRLRDSLDEAHREMRELLSSDTPDESAVMKQAERLGALETEANKSRLRGMLKIRSLLTPEQRAVLVEIHEERRSRHGERRRGPGRPGGPPEKRPDE
jgi:Spy/CpxP family protein refolding chaperone